MVNLHTLWTMALQAAGALGLVILMIACKQISDAISKKFLNEADLKQIDALQTSAATAVRAADQKIGDASVFVTQVLGDKPTRNDMTNEIVQWNELYKKQKTLTNDQKKDMVLDFLEAKFPNVPFEEIEIHLEKAYQDYKNTMATVK